MLTIVCSVEKCRTALRLRGEFEEMESLFGEKSEWYPDSYPCPTCKQPMSIIDSISPSALAALSVHDLTAGEAYAAFKGMGLPEEQDCGPTAVSNVLLNKRVVKLDVRLIKGSHRSVLNSIEFEDGTRMFLAASPVGATVYRIAPKRSYTEEALREHD